MHKHPGATTREIAEKLGAAPRTIQEHLATLPFATEFLIANDFNIYATSEKLGDKAATVERHYIDKARARAAMDDQFRMKQIRGGSR